MKSKHCLNDIMTIFVIAIMVGASEVLGEKEIIFPEITAIAIGLFIAPHRSWQVNKARILILISICSVLGLMISLLYLSPYGLKCRSHLLYASLFLSFQKQALHQ